MRFNEIRGQFQRSPECRLCFGLSPRFKEQASQVADESSFFAACKRLADQHFCFGQITFLQRNDS
nr:hypothetical protein [Collimonas arenae]